MPTGGGLLQLVARGKQDIFLTGNPQTTFFKLIYRRHTNFATQSQIMIFDGITDFGKTVICTVPRAGDLLGKLYLRVTLPQLTQYGTAIPVSYVNAIGHALINYITIEIGEKQVDKQTGEWMEVWSQLTTRASQTGAMNSMIGRVDGYAAPDIIASSVGGLVVYIPLQFWFCRNPGLYLPLIALQYHPVRIRLNIAPLQNLAWIPDIGSGTNTTNNQCNPTANIVNDAHIIDMAIWGDYVFLDKEERRTFVESPLEYLIEQVQDSQPISVPESQFSVQVPIEFNNPIKEFIMLVQRKQAVLGHEYFNYSSLNIGESFPFPLPYPISGYITPGTTRVGLLDSAVLLLDGFERFDERDSQYFDTIQPYDHHTSTPVGSFINIYSLALRPEEVQPSGSLNASRIDKIVWQFKMNQLLNNVSGYTKGDCTVRIYGLTQNIFKVCQGMGGVLFST